MHVTLWVLAIAGAMCALWFEWDLPGPATPTVLLCVDPSFTAREEVPQSWVPLRGALEVLHTALAGRAPSERHLAAVSRLLETLPRGGRLTHLTLTPHRGSRATKVQLQVPDAEVERFLLDARWPGDRGALRLALGLVGRTGKRLSVQLAVDEQLEPMVAIEHYPPPSRTSRPIWEQFLARLVALGLARSEEAHAAVAWLGADLVHDDATGRAVAIQRALDVKIIAVESRVSAKAYLGTAVIDPPPELPERAGG